MDLKSKFKRIPDKPGIYLFYNKKKELVYVGKASSLKNRVRSYFSGARTSRPIEQFIDEVVDVKYKETDSVLEAIILEANYIKKFLPKYNVDGKDDKSWNYICISKDNYPKVETMRAHELEATKLRTKEAIRKYAYVFGPYPGLNTKATMKLLRRLFFISTCQRKLRSYEATKPCFYYQMGQCLGVCTGEISSTEYKTKVIRPLITFLKGGKKRLISTLERRMKKVSGLQNFEEAARLRNQIKALKRIHDIALLNKSFFGKEKLQIKNYKLKINKIEGYDVSNLGATGKVGSMVVFVNGHSDKKQYRKFKIKTVKGQSDVDCLAEIVERRLKHGEWKMPNLFLIDGGKPQVNRVKKILRENKTGIPVVGIVKGPQRKRNDFILDSNNKSFVDWVKGNKRLLIAVRDEAHRFAIAYQRKLRSIK